MKNKRKRKMSNGMYIMLGIFIVGFAYTRIQGFLAGVPVIVGQIILVVCFGVILFGIYRVISRYRKGSEIGQSISEIEDPDEKLKRVEELYRKGQYQSAQAYLNQLSIIHYEKGDYEKALKLIQDAARYAGKEIRVGANVTTSDMLKMNEILYLIALNRFDEATEILDWYDENPHKNVYVQHSLKGYRAQLAIEKGDVQMARYHLSQMEALSLKGPKEQIKNLSYHSLLLEARCDMLENDTPSALAKLDDIISHCRYPFTVKQAKELRDALQRE